MSAGVYRFATPGAARIIARVNWAQRTVPAPGKTPGARRP